MLEAVVGGIVATTLWTAAALGWRWLQMRRALEAFVGAYSIHRKLHPNEHVGTVTIRRNGRNLSVAFLERNTGNAGIRPGIVRGTLAVNERFRKSGQGAYVQRFADGGLAWGTWDVELDGLSVFVTTRYAHPEKYVEVVQGYEWRYQGPVESASL